MSRSVAQNVLLLVRQKLKCAFTGRQRPQQAICSETVVDLLYKYRWPAATTVIAAISGYMAMKERDFGRPHSAFQRDGTWANRIWSIRKITEQPKISDSSTTESDDANMAEKIVSIARRIASEMYDVINANEYIKDPFPNLMERLEMFCWELTIIIVRIMVMIYVRVVHAIIYYQLYIAPSLDMYMRHQLANIKAKLSAIKLPVLWKGAEENPTDKTENGERKPSLADKVTQLGLSAVKPGDKTRDQGARAAHEMDYEKLFARPIEKVKSSLTDCLDRFGPGFDGEAPLYKRSTTELEQIQKEMLECLAEASESGEPAVADVSTEKELAVDPSVEEIDN